MKYVKRSFLPLREFRHLADANRQLAEWVMGEAGNRNHGTTRDKPLTRFVVEKPLLQALPDVPLVSATWATATVHRDTHVQFEACFYSVPFALIGQTLWLKATPSTVLCFREHALVATRPRQTCKGARSTVADPMPPEAQAWAMSDPQWCLKQSERIGPSCHALVRHLFADRVLDNLRAVQGLIRLAKTYGEPRLEAACARALSFEAPRYRTVKDILKNGLDQQASVAAFKPWPTPTHPRRALRPQHPIPLLPLSTSMNPIPELAPQLKQLRLSGILDSLASRNRQAIDGKLAYTDFLALLIQDEVARREQKKLATRLRRAAFRASKTIEQFDFSRLPRINRALIQDLATGRYLDEKVAVLIAGPCGTGKSHLAQALGHCAVHQGAEVLFTTASQLVSSAACTPRAPPVQRVGRCVSGQQGARSIGCATAPTA